MTQAFKRVTHSHCSYCTKLGIRLDFPNAHFPSLMEEEGGGWPTANPVTVSSCGYPRASLGRAAGRVVAQARSQTGLLPRRSQLSSPVRDSSVPSKAKEKEVEGHLCGGWRGKRSVGTHKYSLRIALPWMGDGGGCARSVD